MGLRPKPHQEPEVLGFPDSLRGGLNHFYQTARMRVVFTSELKPARSENGSLRGLESRARCAGFSVMEIGNRKKRLRFYTSFPDWNPSGGFGIEATRPLCGI